MKGLNHKKVIVKGLTQQPVPQKKPITLHCFLELFTEQSNSLHSQAPTQLSVVSLWFLHFPNFSHFHKRIMSIVAEAVTGAASSTFFDVLFDNLSSPDLLKIFRQKNVDADLRKWKRTLLKIHAVLEDAEERQMTSRLVKIWLDELEEDLVYDVDDILDEFATEASRRKLHEKERSTSKIRKFIPACCVDFNPKFYKV